MIIIIAENQILKTNRIVVVDVGNGKDWNVLAKLERETVILGSYSRPQAQDILEAIRSEIVMYGGVYEMPERND